MPRTKAQRLFGAACLRIQLERNRVDPNGSEIYQGALDDLDLEDNEVEAYIRDHRAEVETALDSGRRPSGAEIL